MGYSEKDILERAKIWTKKPYNDDCINEIKKLLDENNISELTERFGADLEFGTGGMRGIIRNGTNGMNIYVVAMATQGLANYVNKTVKNGKACIAYDSRLYSSEFAKEAAIVLASNGIKTYLFSELRPTPELSFAIRYLGCTTGIVITASHNPKKYNGYKVYWDDGSQIIEPHDELIIKEVRNITKLEDVKKDDFNKLINNGMIQIIDKEVDKAFLDEVQKVSINKNIIKDSNVKIVYTPLHGTGATLIPDALNNMGFKDIIYVKEQMIADSNFSTVEYPNPEEKEALNMGLNLAKQNNADILIATDPDADRMGIACKDKNGEYKIITGNQIGAILEYYILSSLQEKNSIPENGAIVKTIVTTELQDKIAESFGVKVFNVLTGFKYIAQKIRNFENDKNFTYLFGCEESYGYLPGIHARDKDAITSTVLIAECCAYLKTKNITIPEYLEQIFKKYGYYYEDTKSKTIEGLSGLQQIKKIMEEFRKNPPDSFYNNKIIKKEDYLFDKIPDSKDSPYYLPKSNVIKYYLDNGCSIVLRPSGTEPKIKFYFLTKSDTLENAKELAEIYKKELLSKVDEILQK